MVKFYTRARRELEGMVEEDPGQVCRLIETRMAALSAWLGVELVTYTSWRCD